MNIKSENREGSENPDQSEILEIYKMYVQTIENISARRQSANSYFLTVNTAIVGLVSYFDKGVSDWAWLVSLAGVILCYAWYRLVRSYRDLNSGKFKVIHKIEAKLPIAPFDMEWDVLKKGKDHNVYLPFTKIEMWVPRVFLAVHIYLLISKIPWQAKLLCG